MTGAMLLVGCGGTVGSGSTRWQYTAMGDSLAVGILATQGYVVRYQNDLASDNVVEVNLTDLGQDGWHSGDLLNALQTDQNFQSSVMSAQVVTWDIGGDDLLHAVSLFQNGSCGGADNQDCLRSAVATFIPNWDAIVQQTMTLRSPSNTILRTMDVYNPFVAQSMADGTFDIIETYLDQVNAHIAASAAANNIPMAQVHLVFNGPNGDQDAGAQGLLAIDGIHPNDAGHALIAQQLRALGYGPLK